MSDQCHRFRVRSLRDAELLSGLLTLVMRGNELTAEMLVHLIEIEQRMLFAELGFPSLFAYCVESLGLSEGAAGRRCAAARVCRRFPEAFEHVARGHLHLSALCGLSKYLTPQNAAELFGACTGKTRRQVDEVLAARFPRPLVREMLRRLPERSLPLAANTLPSNRDRVQTETRLKAGALELQSDHADPKELGISDIPSRESRPAAPAAASATDAPSRALASATTQTSVVRLRGQGLESLTVDRYKVQFTADGKLRDLIERASALCGHSAPNEIAKVIARALELFVQHEEKRRFSIGAKPRTSHRNAQTLVQTARAKVHANPPSAKTKPPKSANPLTAKTEPATVDANPLTAKIEPATSDADRRTAKIEPATADADRRTAKTEPATSDGNPLTATTEPDARVAHPLSAKTEPTTSDTYRLTATIEPATADGSPVTATTEPDAGVAYALTTKTEPDAGVAYALTAKTEPDARVTAKTEPDADLVYPLTTTTEPATADANPLTATTERGVPDANSPAATVQPGAPDVNPPTATAERATGDVNPTLTTEPHARDAITHSTGSGGADGSRAASGGASGGRISRAKAGATGSTPPGGVTPQAASTKPRSRHVPVEVRREVYTRDRGQCSFVAEDGRRCKARARLELDHVEPWAKMGANEASNLRLRCRAHNLLHAKHCFGALHLAAKVAARQREARCRAARSAQS